MKPLQCFAIVLLAASGGGHAGQAHADGLAHVFERPVTGNRDQRNNRTALFGAGPGGGAGGCCGGTAIANSVAVTQQGSGNTLILNVTQNNSGNITAGTTLNGGLSLD